VTEAWPEELVVPLDALRVPVLADHVMDLLVKAAPPEVRVAVRVVKPPESSVKLLGEIDRAVEGGVPVTVRLSKYVGLAREDQIAALPEL
jgi:hypothetical protein